MDPKVAKKTQDTLGKIIKKPPLTEKLLGKPPFRFLHDIMTSVIKTTGFMKGLYTESEMNSDNVKDRDSKTAFLQKAIDLVSVATGKTCGAKPSKIVAGHEPEKTNEFLQALAAAINAKVDNEECVNRVLNKGSSGKTEEKKSRDRESSADKRTKDEDKKSRDREDNRERSRDRERSKDKGDREKEDRHRDRDDRQKEKEDRHKDREERHRESRHKSGRSRQAPEDIDVDLQDDDITGGLDIADDDMIGSDIEFIAPYNSPNEKFDTTYSVEKAPQDYAGEQSSARHYNYLEQRHDWDEQEIEEMEELRRRQGSRTSRSNRPKAAGPRRRSLVKSEETLSSSEKVDRVMLDREEGSGSEDSEPEKAMVLKKRKSGTKSRLSNRKKSETEELPIKEEDIVEPKRKKGSLKELKGTSADGSLRGPKTSTPKNSPDGGLIPVKESRMNLQRSPLKAPVVDKRRSSKTKVLDPPTKMTAGARRLSMKDQGPRKLASKEQEIKTAMGQSTEKEGSTKVKDRMPDSAERRMSGSNKGKASDIGKVPYVREVDEAGRSVVSHKKLKEVYEDDSERQKLDQYSKEASPKSTRRKSVPRQIIKEEKQSDERIKKDKIGSEEDQLSNEKKDEGVKVERKKSRSKTKLARRQRREEEGKENDAPGNEMVNGEREPKEAAPQRLQRPSSAKGSRRRMEGSKSSLAVVAKGKQSAAVTVKSRQQASKMASNMAATSKQPTSNLASKEKQPISSLAGKGKQPSSKMSVKFKEPLSVTASKRERSSLKITSKVDASSDIVKSSSDANKFGNESSEEDTPAPRREREKAPEPSLGDDDLPPQVAAGRLARPSSARPAPPKRKEDTIQNEPAMRLGSGKPQNLIIDDGKESDEDETFVVEEPAPPPIEQEQSAMKSRLEEDDDDEDHGGLVKKIMETKKEYEQTRTTEIERPTVSDAQRRKQREAVQREIDKLRTSIQTLTRSANPLGKIMDYVQEDLDSMQKELEKWKSENKEHGLALKREKAITERAVEPLKVQLSEVDQAINDQLDLIGAVKSNIIRNDMKIEKMLRTIAKS